MLRAVLLRHNQPKPAKDGLSSSSLGCNWPGDIPVLGFVFFAHAIIEIVQIGIA
jgi:hypothetical protein